MSIDIHTLPSVEELIRRPGTRVWVNIGDQDDWFNDEELRDLAAEIQRARREYRRRQMIAEEARAAASPMTNYWPSRWKETHGDNGRWPPPKPMPPTSNPFKAFCRAWWGGPIVTQLWGDGNGLLGYQDAREQTVYHNAPFSRDFSPQPSRRTT